ncbi:unnamed protein product [Hermetia illucens]|uniref:Uncharacterized protein n=1 Tax=Hermetia illucens TaxID=343691 RepID=A0A7R8UHV9_HERIL|nr:unnamed protein product [Hermetia illucens]
MKFAVVLLAVVAAASATPILPLASIGAPIAPALSVAPLAVDPLLSNVAISAPIVRSSIIAAPALAPAVAPLSLGLDPWAAPAVVDLWKKKRAA